MLKIENTNKDAQNILVERIKTMENKFDRATVAVENLDKAMAEFESVISEVNELIDYYQSDLWKADFEADCKGTIPSDLKRGILSEDGIYNLLTDYQRLKDLIQL